MYLPFSSPFPCIFFCPSAFLSCSRFPAHLISTPHKPDTEQKTEENSCALQCYISSCLQIERAEKGRRSCENANPFPATLPSKLQTPSQIYPSSLSQTLLIPTLLCPHTPHCPLERPQPNHPSRRRRTQVPTAQRSRRECLSVHFEGCGGDAIDGEE